MFRMEEPRSGVEFSQVGSQGSALGGGKCGNSDVPQELAMVLGWNCREKWPYRPQNFSPWVSLLTAGTQNVKIKFHF